MQLKIQRSQRQGALSSKVIFCLDARTFLTREEQANVVKYRLGTQVIYNSRASARNLDKADDAGRQGNYLTSLTRTALAALQLNITVDSLQRGQHIECKDMEELLSTEEALLDACKCLKGFLEAAATFDGREVVIDFSEPEPVAVAQPLSLPASSIQPAPVILATAAVPEGPAVAGAASLFEPMFARPAEGNIGERLRDWFRALNAPEQIALSFLGLVVLGAALAGWWGVFALGLITGAVLLLVFSLRR